MKWFHQELVLIPDLEDEVVYTSFLNGLKNERFKFPLAEQKETTLARHSGRMLISSEQLKYA